MRRAARARPPSLLRRPALRPRLRVVDELRHHEHADRDEEHRGGARLGVTTRSARRVRASRAFQRAQRGPARGSARRPGRRRLHALPPSSTAQRGCGPSRPIASASPSAARSARRPSCPGPSEASVLALTLHAALHPGLPVLVAAALLSFRQRRQRGLVMPNFPSREPRTHCYTHASLSCPSRVPVTGGKIFHGAAPYRRIRVDSAVALGPLLGLFCAPEPLLVASTSPLDPRRG